MQTFHIARLCTVYGLGDPVCEPETVSGGALHRMWRLTTIRGVYALKELNPTIMRKPHIYEAYRLTERIAAALATHDIPAITALAPNGDPLQTIKDTTFLVYPWVDGVIYGPDSVAPERARHIGTILGRIHTLQLQFAELDAPEWEPLPEEDWDVLTFHAADMKISWAYPVRALLPQLLAWSKQEAEAGHVLSKTMVVSHRDLDQKSVIWHNERTPYLIDWEAAGLINPTVELVRAALSWSGLHVGLPQEETFTAVMEGYVQAGGTIHNTGIDALHGVMGHYLGWLLFSMRRSTGESITSEEERQLGIEETAKTLPVLRNLEKHAETWASWIDRWRKL